jgi:hypothetical protein
MRLRTHALPFALATIFLVTMTVQILAPHSAEAAEVCPSDGITRVTSGSTATGSTCNQAFSNLVTQELAKMNCDFGLYSYEFFHNGCHWTGSTYQTTGWYEYECQTDCYNPQV